jgi:transcriptional regulator with XRE-family HTH domain
MSGGGVSSQFRAFGERVRARREQLGLSQEELASRAGLHRTYVGSVERGERNISLENIHRLAKALGVDAGQLVSASSKGKADGSR